jgi:hypothetical protein
VHEEEPHLLQPQQVPTSVKAAGGQQGAVNPGETFITAWDTPIPEYPEPKNTTIRQTVGGEPDNEGEVRGDGGAAPEAADDEVCEEVSESMTRVSMMRTPARKGNGKKRVMLSTMERTLGPRVNNNTNIDEEGVMPVDKKQPRFRASRSSGEEDHVGDERDTVLHGC